MFDLAAIMAAAVTIENLIRTMTDFRGFLITALWGHVALG